MANRTFGWIQNPSSTETLRDILSLFVPGSPFHEFMQEKRLPFLASANLFQDPGMFLEFQKLLRRKGPIKFEKLKGQGNKGKSRTLAKCSGLAQAAVTGQKNMTYIVDGEKISTKKPYTDDWTADGFLRWAISLGFLDYNYSDDSCDITTLGKSFVGALTEEEKNKILPGGNTRC